MEENSSNTNQGAVTPETGTPSSEENTSVAPQPRNEIADKLRARMRRDGALVEQRRRAKEEKQAVEDARHVLDLSRTDPLKFLEMSGVHRDKLTELAQNKAPTDPASKALKQIEEMEARLSALTEKAETEQTAQEFSGYEAELGEYFQGQTDRFPVLSGTPEAGKLVLQRMQQISDQTGEVPSEDEVAEIIESESKALYEHLHGIFGGVNESRVSDAITPGAQPSILTNQLAADGTSSAPVDTSEMTDRQRREYYKLLAHRHLTGQS